jgi:flagellar biosynthesis protein FlhB
MAASVLQNRPRITTSAIKPQWSRVNPKTGLKRLAPPQLLFESGNALAKAGVVSIAALPERPRSRGARAIRRRQFQQARKRMIADLATAGVSSRTRPISRSR